MFLRTKTLENVSEPFDQKKRRESKKTPFTRKSSRNKTLVLVKKKTTDRKNETQSEVTFLRLFSGSPCVRVKLESIASTLSFKYIYTHAYVYKR